MSVNIGEKIQQRAKELRIGPTELGELLNTSKQNIYSIYKRKSLDAETLRKLSVALKYDFFDYFKPAKLPETFSDITEKYTPEKSKVVAYSEYAKLKADYEHLKEKYELLKKVNLLLEGRTKKQGFKF
jgi:transcriptional regulator with XRE-family HTH domain